MVMVAQQHECNKCPWIVHLKWLKLYILYYVYFITVIYIYMYKHSFLFNINKHLLLELAK